MKTRDICAAVFVVACLGVPLFGAAPPVTPPEPVKGVYTRGIVLACVEIARSDYKLVEGRYVPLQGGKSARTPGLAPNLANGLGLRWHVSDDYLWVPDRKDGGGYSELLMRFDLPALLEGRRRGGEGDKGNEWGHVWSMCSFDQLSFSGAGLLGGELELAMYRWHTHLPVGKESALLFDLKNYCAPDEKVLEEPRWGMDVIRYWNTWDAKKGEWGQKQRDEYAFEIDVGRQKPLFREQFQALKKGDDYFFLTQSGRLFVAPKPKKGTDRVLRPVHTDATRRVEAFVVDADNDRTYLFCQAAKRGERPTYFELSDAPRFVPYDPPVIDARGMHPDLAQVLRCARVLRADKLLSPVVARKDR